MQQTSGGGPRELATLTSKGQVTVPKAVREALGLRQGDQLSWEVENGSARVRVVSPLDLTYLQGLESTLQEWSSEAERRPSATCDATSGPFRRAGAVSLHRSQCTETATGRGALPAQLSASLWPRAAGDGDIRQTIELASGLAP